ncbi:MAG TPA: DUF1207 domain-containing protein [Ignavibacteriaceae bacterium]|nr:DUF1207 domain-containing protein [Ignavibacteriaceae bacterium]
MKRFFLILNFIFIFTKISNSQTETAWFPDELNIQPFTSSLLEPRAGFQYLFGIEKVQINIGTSHDVIHFISDGRVISLGADFFTYTRARNEDNFRFPVETIDYLFGVNAGYKFLQDKSEWGVRLRLSHISAHLVDGLFNSDTNEWLDGRKPFVYSREFIEMLGYYNLSGLRIYAGVNYNLHIIPGTIKKGVLQLGFDYYAVQLSTGSCTPFIAYDFKLSAIEEYTGNNTISAGIKFGNPYSRGFSIFTSYYSGKSNHGEFFDLSENYFTIGINLDI